MGPQHNKKIVPPSTSNRAKPSSKKPFFLRDFGIMWGTIWGIVLFFHHQRKFPSQKEHCHRIAAAAAVLPPSPPPFCRHHHHRHWRPCPLLSPLSLSSLVSAPSAVVAFVYIVIIAASLLPFSLPFQLLLLVDCWLFVPPPPPPPCCRAAAATALLPPLLPRRHCAGAASTAKLPPLPLPPSYCCCNHANTAAVATLAPPLLPSCHRHRHRHRGPLCFCCRCWSHRCHVAALTAARLMLLMLPLCQKGGFI